ncbi:uncharacterized protein [Penaeus vannamei]|uniref:uncharacterized protein isoform X8 n=1 Tax=Penaeus vannamei TaxID=6689 RepID=UPI00387F74AD
MVSKCGEGGESKVDQELGPTCDAVSTRITGLGLDSEIADGSMRNARETMENKGFDVEKQESYELQDSPRKENSPAINESNLPMLPPPDRARLPLRRQPEELLLQGTKGSQASD